MMFLFFQVYVGLRDDDPNNIWLEEKHLEQLLDCWFHVCVEAHACLVFLQQYSDTISQNAPRLKRIVGHPVLLWLVLEYFLAMVD